MIRFYEYKACSTCQRAAKFLTAQGVDFERIPIVDQPPSVQELKLMLKHLQSAGGTFKNLFNTSGQVYREMEISQKLKDGLTEDQAIELLSKNGKLIKRPFALTSKAGLVGFRDQNWKQFLKECV